MLTQIDLQYFKCFELLRLPVSSLTLLSGGNASGKSSVLQSLVLLHQTIREHEWSTRLMLNGDAIQMGTVSDVIDKVGGRHTFEIGLADDERTYNWKFVGERSEMSVVAESVAVNGVEHGKPEKLQHLMPPDADESALSLARRLQRLMYITAERIGPREFYPLEDSRTATVVGSKGEYAVSLLHQGRDEKVLPEIALPGVPPTRLRQVEERMRTIFPGCAIELQQVPQANAVTLGLRTSNDTDFHRPIHVGFGLTQIFPIIVAALSAAKGDILLVENPEVHLHPAGQADMGIFLADVAHVGVQVIIETHSDHVLNGVRRAVKSARIDAGQVAVYFFKPRSAEQAQVQRLIVDSSGNIDTWPDGFFDQFDKDMNYFAGWGE